MQSQGDYKGIVAVEPFDYMPDGPGCAAWAIGYLRENFDQPLRIDDLAHELGMSVSGFHHHFKSVTTINILTG